MNHSRLTAAFAVAVGALTSVGVAGAQSCAERATRLKTEIDALPSSSSSQTGLSELLGIAMGSDTVRCDEILARVEKELAAASEATAPAEKPVPNSPASPAGPATAPEVDEGALGAANGKGHAAGNDLVSNDQSGNAPPATGADGMDGAPDAMVEQGETAHVSGDDPIPTQAADADDGEATPAN